MLSLSANPGRGGVNTASKPNDRGRSTITENPRVRPSRTSSLGVWSRHFVVRICDEPVRFGGPPPTDGFVGCEALQGLQPPGEVIGVEEQREVAAKLVVAAVVVAPDGGVLEGPVHPLDLPKGHAGHIGRNQGCAAVPMAWPGVGTLGTRRGAARSERTGSPCGDMALASNASLEIAWSRDSF
jgi:hypothetical protein